MPRVTLRVPSDVLDDVDALVDAGVYPSRSAAFRAGVDELLEEDVDPLVASEAPTRLDLITDGGQQ